MFINRISNTKSNVISECLYKYWAHYIKRYIGLDSNKDALNFGSYIHKIFELGFEEKSEKGLLQIAEQVKGDFQVFDKSYTNKTKKCVRNFLKFNKGLKKTIGTERRLEVELSPGITFVGVVDRVIEGKDGGILIIDYKTSKKEKTRASLYQDGQMRGYAWAISEEMKIPIEKITCAHYYPITGNFVPVKFKKGDIAHWKKKEIAKVWDIRKRKANQFPPTQNKFCNWCSYKHICPLFNNTVERENNILLEEKKLEQKKLNDGRQDANQSS